MVFDQDNWKLSTKHTIPTTTTNYLNMEIRAISRCG